MKISAAPLNSIIKEVLFYREFYRMKISAAPLKNIIKEVLFYREFYHKSGEQKKQKEKKNENH
tara:strand:+ start:459 stop:647 length:189 start_codon:yes stop_codon:yes gene_type:complete